ALICVTRNRLTTCLLSIGASDNMKKRLKKLRKLFVVAARARSTIRTWRVLSEGSTASKRLKPRFSRGWRRRLIRLAFTGSFTSLRFSKANRRQCNNKWNGLRVKRLNLHCSSRKPGRLLTQGNGERLVNSMTAQLNFAATVQKT